MDRLEKVQRSTKMIEGLGYLERLGIFNLTTLETRFLRADLIEVYKILNGLDKLDLVPGTAAVRRRRLLLRSQRTVKLTVSNC